MKRDMAWHSKVCLIGIFNNMVAKRNTLQRQLIFDALRELNIHATAEQVVEYLALKYPAIGRATVYRNLNQMAQSGEILKIDSFYGSTHYDHNCHEHYHFKCNECNQIIDVDGNLADVVNRFSDTSGFDITDCNISFSGLCWTCKDLSS